MESSAYDPQTKQVYLQFGNVSVAIDVEDYMDFLYVVVAMKDVIEKDPEVTLGTFTDDEGNEIEEFIVKDQDEEYS
jgi:hypothetical protein